KYIRGDNIGETPNCVDGSEDCPPTSTAYTTVQDPNHTLSDNSLSVSFIEVETIQVDIPVDELFCDDMAGDNDYRMSNGIQNTAAKITASVFPNPAHSLIQINVEGNTAEATFHAELWNIYGQRVARSEESRVGRDGVDSE